MLEEEGAVVNDASIDLQQQMAGCTEITLYALLGSPSPGTMRVWSRINHQDVLILIDNGSTHNFLDVSSWSSLKLPLSTQESFTVKVANGEVLRTQGACHEVNLKIQGQDLQVDLNVLSLGDCDVVLGTQWLYTLRPIKWDFKKLVMEFSLGGKGILFTGLQPSGLTLQEVDQFFKPVIKKGLLLQIISCPTPSTPMQQHGAITELLQEFNKVFEVPAALPPLRGHEHQIVLKEGTEPICERPYRYPFYQKTKIEKIAHDLLEAGYIRISHSPFSSPVLLVRKVDGS